MKRGIKIIAWLILLTSFSAFGQESKDVKTYYAGFKTIKLADTSRIYKPNSAESDSLHYRPVDLDVWYPSSSSGSNKLLFKDLFFLLEQRANQYQKGNDYTGLTNELAQFYAVESGFGINDAEKLLQVETNSYLNLIPSVKKYPLIIYMAGLNGMGFENYRILEKLAEKGFIVVSIWSVGRYPGNMTNDKLDMMEQVYDAEFALNYIKSKNEFSADLNSIGVLAYSWGGMSASVFLNRNPDVTTFISLDGSETNYFGKSNEDDTYIREILNSNLLNRDSSSISYLFLESGNKLEDYVPTDEYHYFKKLNSKEKYYLRFLNSKHEDFTSLPSALHASQSAIELHDQIMEGAIGFFEANLKNEDVFRSYYSKASRSDKISVEPFNSHRNFIETILLHGQILDSKTKLPLAFASVGFLIKETGTVSNENGEFKFHINPEMENDSLRVSMIGYKAKVFSMKELVFQKRNKIELDEDINQLDEIIISTKDLEHKNIGNKTTSRFISTGFGYDQLGAEIGIKINVKKRPTFVDTFNFNISYNRLSAKALFRLNIYEIENGKPSKNVVTENIIIPIDAKQTGLISIDLKAIGIVLHDDVIATLEWVKIEGEINKGEAIFLSLGVFNNGTLIKQSSQGKFKKYRSMGVGINLDVRY